jgi:tetratricopeptide (TPR) repeat protein
MALPAVRFIHHLLRARDWQNRPQFDELCRWWRDGGIGVCALVGIGGAGKTSIVDRFLQILPGALPPILGIAKDDRLSAPEKLFVFSFYDAPNPDHFFIEVALWLGYDLDNASSSRLSYQQVIRTLGTSGQCLLVLDGLEKIQDSGARGGTFGQILDGRLVDMVLKLAIGYLSNVKVIITTRFPIAQLDDAFYSGQAPHYLEIQVEEISLESGVQLLKDRGVHGSNAELEDIVIKCGRHALTVDLAGGYLVEFEGGRASAPLDIGDLKEIEQILEEESNPRRRIVLKQELRFAKVAEQYKSALIRNDPAALALVERVCLFRLGVDDDTLIEIFTGPGKEGISGPDLAAISAKDVRAKLQKLLKMRILNVSKTQSDPDIAFKSSIDNTYNDEFGSEKSIPSVLGSQNSIMLYTVHPAIRDGFLKGLDRNTAREGHEAVRRALIASLGSQPGELITDPSALDLIEEIIYHSIESGNIEEAIDLYEHRLEGVERTLFLGDYSRIDRICHAIISAFNPKDLKSGKLGDVIPSWIIAKLRLGQMAAAKNCMEYFLSIGLSEKSKETLNDDEVFKFLFFDSQIYLLSGLIDKSIINSKQAYSKLKELENFRAEDVETIGVILCTYNGYCNLLRGRIEEAVHAFNQSEKLNSEMDDDNKKNLPMFQGLFYGELYALSLYRLGKHDIARKWCEKILKGIEDFKKEEEDLSIIGLIPRMKLAYAQCLQPSDVVRSQELVDDATEWAVLNDVRELLCWASLIQGRLKTVEAIANSDENRKSEQLTEALKNFEEGIYIAREYGFSLYHIDLLVERAAIHLQFGDWDEAISDLNIALTDGHKPDPETGLPPLLAAMDHDCGYAWGEGDTRHMLGEALLLQAAQLMGRSDFVPARLPEQGEEVITLIDTARGHLEKSLELRKRIQDPKVADTKRVLDQLKGGLLTPYSLKPIGKPESTLKQPQYESLPVMSTIKRTKVFVSYSRKDAKLFHEFKTMLAPTIQKGLVELWDDTMIKPGAKWRDEIISSIAAAKVGVLLVSPSFLASDFIIENELPKLLKAAQDEGVKIFWVCLSSCLYEQTEIGQYQAAHDVGRPLDSLEDAERMATLKNICSKLLQTLEKP